MLEKSGASANMAKTIVWQIVTERWDIFLSSPGGISFAMRIAQQFTCE